MLMDEHQICWIYGSRLGVWLPQCFYNVNTFHLMKMQVDTDLFQETAMHLLKK